MKNKKGFTLIELLATIALLGVVLTIATISISSIGDRVKQRQRANIQADLKIAASKYVANTGTKKVYVETLIEQGYITADNDEKDIYDPVTKDSLNCHYWDFTGDEPKFIKGDCSEDTIEYHEFDILYCYGTGCTPNKKITDGWLNGKQTVLGTNFREPGATFLWINPLAPDLVFSGQHYEINSFPSGYINEIYEVVVSHNSKEYRESVRVKIDVANPVVTIHVDDNDVWTKDKMLHAEFKDNESGLKEYAVTSNGASPSSWTKVPADNKISQTITKNDTYTVWIKDNAGNVSSDDIIVDKIDVYPPSVPTSEIRKDNSSGASLSNTTNWRNYTVWWGNWNSTDNESDVVKYEYSTGCTETVSGTLKAEGYTYSDNDYTFCIRAVDTFGNASKWSNPVYFKVDTTKPTCKGTTGSSPSWTNSDRTITLKCDDNVSGCEKEEYTKKYTTSTTNDTVTIKDNAGNTNTCTYNVYVDKTSPTCGDYYDSSTKKSPTWTNSDKKISQGCNDTGGSGCAKNVYETSYNSNTTTGSVIISDNAGNTKSCSYDVLLDKTAPTCGTVSGASTSWTNSSRTITQKCNDIGGSGCAKATYSQEYSTTTKTGSATIKDNAGNTESCSYNVYVDKTAPTVSSFSLSSTEDNYNTKDVSISASFSESHSGIAGVCISSTDSSSDCSWSSHTTSTYSSSHTFTSDYEGEKYTLYIFVKDKAGNVSSSKDASYTVYTACTNKEVDDYGEWGECDKTCGGGTKYRDVYYVDAYLGTSCPKGTDSDPCNTHSCCTTSEWSCDECAENGTKSCTRTDTCTNNTSKTESCTYTINDYRYEGCNKYYITTCTNNKCTYTEKNGAAADGTIDYSKLSTSLGSNCKATCGAYINSGSKNGSSVKFETWGSCSAISSGVSGGGCSKTKTYNNGFRVSFGSSTSCTFYMKTQVTATWGDVYTYNHSWNTKLCESDTDKAGCYCTYSGSGGSNTCKSGNTACAC